MRHYRVSTREHWDRLVSEADRWAATWGETAALWLNTQKMSVRFVSGADAQEVTQGWLVLWAVTPGEPRPEGISEMVWVRYDRQRAEYEAGLGRGHKQPYEPLILGVGGPPERHNSSMHKTGERKKRSDAGKMKGPRHLRAAKAGQIPIIVED